MSLVLLLNPRCSNVASADDLNSARRLRSRSDKEDKEINTSRQVKNGRDGSSSSNPVDLLVHLGDYHVSANLSLLSSSKGL